MTDTLFDRIVNCRQELHAGEGDEDECDALLADCQKRIEELETSILKHFQEEHLAGDGPEIQRWKSRLAEAQNEIEEFERLKRTVKFMEGNYLQSSLDCAEALLAEASLIKSSDVSYMLKVQREIADYFREKD